MARLDARWSHFFARGKTYKHFWQSTTALVSAAGDMVTVAASIIPGQASVSVSVDGQALIATTDLIVPPISVDAAAPLNTRLNARYRHFWGRRQVWRHDWAQWEGAGISGVLADGDLVIASLAVVVNGEVAAHANVEGDLLEVIATMQPGVATVDVNADPALLVLTTSIAESGAARGDAHAAGTIISVQASVQLDSASDESLTVRGMPPAYRHSKPSINGFAQGAVITVGVGIDIEGIAADLGDFASQDDKDLMELMIMEAA